MVLGRGRGEDQGWSIGESVAKEHRTHGRFFRGRVQRVLSDELNDPYLCLRGRRKRSQACFSQ